LSAPRTNPKTMTNDVAPPLKSEPKNLTQTARDAIRRDILECRLAPGDRLTVEDLRERLKIGATPLREALMGLTAEGLVLFEPNRGFRVAPVSRHDFDDAVETYIEISLLALKKAIRLGDDAWEGQIVGTFHRMTKLSKLRVDAQRPEMDDQWFVMHQLFHRSLISSCDSRWLTNFYDTIADHTNRYLRLSVEYLSLPRDDESEHEAIMDAVLKRDSRLASTLLKQHLRLTHSKILQIEPSIFGNS